MAYSSTCPCSAALSRQVARDRFLERFPAGASLDRRAVAAWLMFCEDASRRIRRGLETLSWLHDYRIRVQHEESLHPHDAVAVLCKGVPGGFAA